MGDPEHGETGGYIVSRNLPTSDPWFHFVQQGDGLTFSRPNVE